MPVTSPPLGCERPHPRCSFALTLWGTGSSGARNEGPPEGGPGSEPPTKAVAHLQHRHHTGNLPERRSGAGGP